MNLDKVSVEELVASERFQKYCLRPEDSERYFFEEWASKAPANQQLLEEARAIVLRLHLQLDEVEISEAFESLKSTWANKHKRKGSKIVFMNEPKKRRPSSSRWVAIAASISVLIAVAYFAWSYFPNHDPVLISTNFGEMKTHVLPDGSTVILNANSTLSYHESWNGPKQRLVQLEGEAFFEVKKTTSNTSFEVMTNKGTIKVLGTSFNVHQRSKQLKVALLEGKIALGLPEQPVLMMKPGEIARLNADGTLNISRSDVDAVSAWRFQRMVFKEVRIEEITERLKEEFDLNVIIQNETLLKRKITASVPKNDPVLLLKALSELYEIQVESVDDKTFVVR